MALLKMISKKFNKVFTSQDDGTIIEEALKPTNIKPKDTKDEEDDDKSLREKQNQSND